MMRVMILGVTGMLGNAMFRYLFEAPDLTVYGTARTDNARKWFPTEMADHILSGIDVDKDDALLKAFSTVKPDIVVNCVGLVKQLADSNDPLLTVPLNTLLPHKLAGLCDIGGARLIHISTDCVFSGVKGDYVETDFPDAYDLYGRSKLLGEVDYPHAITLRTSIIGHELAGGRSLLGWFLAQKGSIKGFSRAIFSGLPTVELSRVIKEFVIPKPELSGLYHVAAKPINKFDLLTLIAKVYQKDIEIIKDESFIIDRSLNAKRFQEATGYVAPEWPELINKMYDFN